MSSRTEIKFDLKNALEQAERLDDIAGRLDYLSGTAIENSIQSLASSWKGNNASAYLSKEDKLKGDIKITACNVRSIADDIRRIARRVYDAEMEAWRIANRRNS